MFNFLPSLPAHPNAVVVAMLLSGKPGQAKPRIRIRVLALTGRIIERDEMANMWLGMVTCSAPAFAYRPAARQ